MSSFHINKDMTSSTRASTSPTPLCTVVWGSEMTNKTAATISTRMYNTSEIYFKDTKSTQRRGRGRRSHSLWLLWLYSTVSLQVWLGHIQSVSHQVPNAVTAIGCVVYFRYITTALLAVDSVAGHRRGHLAGCLAVDQACVITFIRLGGLADDATLFVGDSGVAAVVLLDNVEVAQDEDQGHGQDGQHHQGDTDEGAPCGKVLFLLCCLENREEKN